MQTTRDESFIPLAPAALPSNERPDFRVTVLSQAGNTQSFQGLGHSDPTHAVSHASGNEPRVSLQRESDRISVIQIHCACGRIVELGCVYEPAPTHTPPAASPAPAPAPKLVAGATLESAAPAPPAAAVPTPDAAPAAADAPKPKPAQAKAREK
jgi:hypothetical protein